MPLKCLWVHQLIHTVMAKPSLNMTQMSSTKDWTDEPHQTVELIWQAHLKEHRCDIGCLHGVAELYAKQDAAVAHEFCEGSTRWEFG